MSLALFALYLTILMSGSEAAGEQCKPSEKSANGKALKGHTFKEVAVKAIIECQNLCESDHRCYSYNYYIPGMVCEMNSETKETKPYDLVTDDQRFYMKREDIDECAQGSHDCLPSLASCINTAGSYNCTCNHGYVGNGKTSCVKAPECQNYQNFSSATRKVTYGEGYNCDDKLVLGWYRFEGAAGTRMASFCPPRRRCGSFRTGWMNGTHPIVADGNVSRRVCFHGHASCCQWYFNIQVRDCGSYYVYYLNRTGGCRFRYCGSD